MFLHFDTFDDNLCLPFEQFYGKKWQMNVYPPEILDLRCVLDSRDFLVDLKRFIAGVS